MKKIRHIIGITVLFLGMLLCLGAMGRMDYLAQRVTFAANDERGAVIKSIMGIVLIGTAAFLNYDMEFEEK